MDRMSKPAKAKHDVLLIEDDEVLRGLMADLLAREGFKVSAAGSGEAALRMAAKHAPEAAVVDIALPDMSGWEICRKLKSDPKTTGTIIVVLSGKVSKADVPLMKQFDVTHLIRKPYDVEHLGSVLKSLLK